jgi:parallel beta-helix repeat protein
VDTKTSPLTTNSYQIPKIKSNSIIFINGNAALAAAASSGSGTLADPYIIENRVIQSGHDGACIIIQNTTKHFILRNCSTNHISDITPAGEYGIQLLNVSNGILLNNTVKSNSYGVYLFSSHNNILRLNVIINSTSGVYSSASNNNYLINNTAINGLEGFYLFYSKNNTLINNTAIKSLYGIELDNSDNNTLINNFAINNSNYGIELSSTNSNILIGNTMIFSDLGLYGSKSEISSHIITPTNTVNGKLVYYFANQRNITAPMNAGEVIFANCNSSTIYGIKISGENFGIRLFYSNNNTIKNITIVSPHYDGIYLLYSNNNTLTNNKISSTSRGISLYYSNNNTINNNNITDNSIGIELDYSNDNTLSNNIISNNSYEGISLYNSNWNTIQNNTAIYNSGGIILASSMNNTIRINIASNNDYAGFFLGNSYYNKLYNNTANNNNYGIYLVSSSYNTIHNNTANSNQYGIYLERSYWAGGSNYNIIKWNTFLDNDQGIYIDSVCGGNIIEGNTIQDRINYQEIIFFIGLGVIICIAVVVSTIFFRRRGIIQLKSDFDKIKRFWEEYNGFTLIAIFFGTLCLFSGWLRQGINYLYVIEYFSYDLNAALIGILYLIGFTFLTFYYIGTILSSHGNIGKLIAKYSKIFIFLSIIILIAFEILTYVYFILPPYPFEQTTICYYMGPCFSFPPPFEISIGFILGTIMVGMVIIGSVYDRLMLQHYYQKYLPEYLPRKL